VDIGCGLPTSGNVHEVAQAVDPACRTVYVDCDTIVLVHARALLADRHTIAVDGDARDPDGIFTDPAVRAHLDLGQPVAVLLTALLHFLDGDEPARIVAAVRDRLAHGSYVVISHASDLPGTTGHPDQAAATRATTGQATATQADGQSAVGRTAATRAAAELYETLVGPFTLRTREQVTALFDGFDLVEPGVVPAQLWRPDQGPSGAAIPVLAGIGRLPESHPACESDSYPVCDPASSCDPVSAFDSCPGPGPSPVRGPRGPGVPGKDRVRVRG
jgi:hypothetical protein